MSTFELVEFDPDRRMAAAYLDLTRRVHEEDPQWIAPLKRATSDLLSIDHPFYTRPGNRHRGFAVRRGGELAGHVLASVNADLRSSDGPVGALGFLEVEPDYELFKDLLEGAIGWLRTQTDVGRIWAPMDLDIWHGYRAMTRGFDTPAFFGEPRNGPWLPEYLERFGFSVRKRWISVTQNRDLLDARLPFFKPRFDEALAHGFRFDEMKLTDAQEMADLRDAINLTFASFDAFTPLSRADFDRLVRGYLRFTGTDLATVLRDEGSKFAGFSVAYADPSNALRRLNGRDDWLGRLRMIRKPPVDTAVYYMVGVTPEVRATRKGLGSALLYKTLQLIRQSDYPLITFALLADDSPARYFAMDQVEAAEREYALYQIEC